ncbi:GNAT family N-acetyltransferase [Gracilibacillus dipsosauri]|uniref:GNAT family N-acetyltransferase n=1 Tax=Gracilibacillus dipsosauri TaxID=178340 RepID=UPI00240932F3
MKIRKAQLEDARGIAKVQVDCWRVTYKNIVPDEYLNNMTYENREQKWKDIVSEQLVYVAEIESGEIIGFSNGGKERTSNYPNYDGELYAIYILPPYQKMGIGKQLLRSVMKALLREGIHSMIVFVLEQNRSRYFYEYLGAEKVDCIEIEIAGKKLNEFVYGWKDIRASLRNSD